MKVKLEPIGAFGIAITILNTNHLSTFENLGLTPGQAICYSGFRDGQHPGGEFPSYDEIKEDLLILKNNWKYLRLYDSSLHAQTVLDVIDKEGLDFKIMLGADIGAEISNPNCPWGGVYDEVQLDKNKKVNQAKIDRLIEMGNKYPEIIFSLSIGNETCVEWTDHLVPEKNVLSYAQKVKANTNQQVTFCENYVPWLDKLTELGEFLDFISIHTYPVWEYKSIKEGLAFTKANYYSVAEKYPDKTVVITEAGWATKSNGQGIDVSNVNEGFQKKYYSELMEWTEKEGILTFFFEAFDENWKGSPDPWEPEKHWGIYRADRTPKLAVNPNYIRQKSTH